MPRIPYCRHEACYTKPFDERHGSMLRRLLSQTTLRRSSFFHSVFRIRYRKGAKRADTSLHDTLRRTAFTLGNSRSRVVQVEKFLLVISRHPTKNFIL